MTEKEELKLKEKIVRAIKTVFDPEIPVDVYELGLIYDIQISGVGMVSCSGNSRNPPLLCNK